MSDMSQSSTVGCTCLAPKFGGYCSCGRHPTAPISPDVVARRGEFADSANTPDSGNSWLVSQDPSSGYPDAIPCTLTEAELVELQELLHGKNDRLRVKLRRFQVESFARAHG